VAHEPPGIRQGETLVTLWRTIMDTFETIRTVLAVRSYQKKPIPPEIIRRIVDAGRLTGSGKNRQPWHFVVVRDPETIVRLGALTQTGPYIPGAAAAVVVAIEQDNFALSDASRAIQSMILTAWSEGVGSNWVGFFGLDAVRSLLGIPDNLDVLAVLPFGYPAEARTGNKKNRKPLDKVAHRERFGIPFV
jgi:nitroreductase